jgi:hypothetical protein
MLEPCAVKVASTVLRGEGFGNESFLPYQQSPIFPFHEGISRTPEC